MNWTYDASARALYVEFSARPSERQIELGPGVIADVDDTGSLVGVEVLNWQSVDIDAIAEQFGLDDETSRTLRWLIYQPVTTFIGYRSSEGSSFISDAEASAPNTTPAPELSSAT